MPQRKSGADRSTAHPQSSDRRAPRSTSFRCFALNPGGRHAAVNGVHGPADGQVRQQPENEHGPVIVFMPSRATFHRLVRRVAEGRHATGSVRTRRNLARQLSRPFDAAYPVGPGELLQIASTPLDIAVELHDGVVHSVRLQGRQSILPYLTHRRFEIGGAQTERRGCDHLCLVLNQVAWAPIGGRIRRPAATDVR